MSKMKTKEIIICILAIIALIISLSAQVFAAQNLDDLDNEVEEESGQIPDRTGDEEDLDADTDTENDDNKIDNKVDNKIENKVDNKVDNKVENKTNNTANNTAKMPNAGVDYSIVFVIITCGVSTIYAYKKIREYNNF